MRDLLVIGGGINGVGIARDAAGRGMAVTLVEKDDLASHTSSASTKLIHGGLRYLENYEFRLVRESLREREVMLRIAPHLVRPMRFVLPYEDGLRPAWMLRLGLFLYDHIGGNRSLPGSSSVDLTAPPLGGILRDSLTRGFAYSDCWVDDARLVVLTAMDAAERGAEIRLHTRCTALERVGDHWRATLETAAGTETIDARAVANAAGPWVDDVADLATAGRAQDHLRLVKGSHIAVPRIYDGAQAYLFQNRDGRIVFAIPYERDFTLIGTTDKLFTGDRNKVAISEEETDYLCAAAGEYFRQPVTPEQVRWSYAGIRPLYDDHAAKNATVTRDYRFEIDAPDRGAPLLSVFGGKITTYRKLAEHALARLARHIDVPGREWTAGAALPGGDLPGGDFAAFLADVRSRWPWLGEDRSLRMAHAYGWRLAQVLGDAASAADLGRDFGAGFTEAELRYLVEREWAQSTEDVLMRRSKLGLHMDEGQRMAVESALDQMA
ncbi:glycerol-3-phosphate dehydrogenase [Tsuneonella mangrovi]|uniref:glycerol-3-phosphate dehydrogenase n=1 Tax=Tsuneonella mangrovi TaxID=1982042 RepID=UPI00196ACBC4|nr:glycerol-3-phosphate dehydrogenase [Tsuneonella mangrovi]